MATPIKLTDGGVGGTGASSPGKGSSPASPGLKHEEEEPTCTERCRSREHGNKIWEISFGGESIEVICLWAKTCLNYSQVKDEHGRTALHAAATTGNLKAVEWLLKTQPCNINGKDLISGYTPFHRSIYFGNLHVARALIKHGADVNIRDNEGLTAFELCQMDRPIPFKQNLGDMTELTVWGSNANYNLGLGHQQPRLFPDVAPDFRRTEMSLAKVAMSTYHTAFLTQSGKVFVCGYGMGGRLGVGEEVTVLTPTQINLKHSVPCKDIAVGQDHTVILQSLDTNNKVWTVGSNEYGQLGQGAGLQIQKLCNPRTVDMLTKYNITGVRAGNFHSIFYNSEVVLMCGQNQGQFGRGFEEDPIIVSPVKLRFSLDNVGNGNITSVGGNEYCTAVCIEKRYIFLLRRHQYARIDSKNTTSQEILKMEATGEKNSITLFLLTSSGRVLVWRDSYNKNTNECKGYFTRVVFSNSRLLDVKDFSVSLSSLVVITSTGEAYKAGWNCNNPPSIVGRMDEKYGQVAGTDFQVAVRARRGKREEEAPSMSLELMKIKRVPNVHTGLFVSSDLKGNNFAVLQRHQMMDITDIPEVIMGNMEEDIAELYQEVHEEDQIHDILFEVGSFNEYPAHMYILASASSVLSRILQAVRKNQESIVKVTNKHFSVDPSKSASLEDPTIFQALLDMIYTRKCNYMSKEWMRSTYACCLNADLKRKGPEYEAKMKDLSKFRYLLRTLGLETEESIIQRFYADVEQQWDAVVIKNACQPTVNLAAYWNGLPKMKFHRSDDEEGIGRAFSDVILETSDKKHFYVHKCILARLEYYKSLFSANWILNTSFGKSKNEPRMESIVLSFSSKAVEILLDYIYTDEGASLKDAETEVLCETLACADFVMTDRLLQLAEADMTKNITLKNAADILTFAWKHNGRQLKNTCFDFISLNLTSMLENKWLEILSVEILEEFSNYYKQSQKMKLLIDRSLKKPIGVPDVEEYEMAVQQTPEDLIEHLREIEDADCGIWMKKVQAKSGRSRVRLRSRTFSENDDSSADLTSSSGVVVDAPFSVVTDKRVMPTERRKEQTPPSTPNTPTVTAVRKLIVPLPLNKEKAPKVDDRRTVQLTPKNSPQTKAEEFPSLGATASRSVSDTKVTTARAIPPTASTSKSDNSISLAQSLHSTKAWKQTGAPEAKEGKCSSEQLFNLKLTSSNAKSPTAPIHTIISNGGSAKKKTKWRTVKSESDVLKGNVANDLSPSGPTTQLTSDGRDRNNPWKTPEKVDKAQVVFKTIVEDEVEKKRNFERATTKALPLMQIEDEVINYLTQRYTSEDTLDYIELLSVERVVTQNFSTPVWVQQHPGAVTAMSSSSYPQFKG